MWSFRIKYDITNELMGLSIKKEATDIYRENVKTKRSIIRNEQERNSVFK